MGLLLKKVAEVGDSWLSLSRNEKLYHLYSFTRGSLFWIPINIAYFSSVGVSPSYTLLAVSVGSISGAVFEFPTGFVGDKYGHKVSMIIGLIIHSIGIGLFLLMPNIYGLFIGRLIISLGISLESGSDSGVLDNISEDFEEGLRMQRLMGLIAQLIAGTASGYLLIIGAWIPFVLTIIAKLIGAIFIYLIKSKKKQERFKGNVSKGAMQSIKFLVSKGVVMYTIVFVLLAAIQLSIKYWGFLWIENFNLSEVSIGYFSSYMIGVMLVSSVVLNYLKRLSLDALGLLMAIPVLLGAVFYNQWLVLIFIPFYSFFSQSLEINMKSKMNKMMDEKLRASKFSALSLMQGGAYSGFIFLLGVLYEVEFLYVPLAFCFLTCLLLIMVFIMNRFDSSMKSNES